MVLAFVDADVLTSPVSRTMAYMASGRADSTFRLVFSPFVEAQAERHQAAGQVRIGELRLRHDWELGPDATGETFGFQDTNVDDRPVLGAAMTNNARFLITRNVRHFGACDLRRTGVSAVHPGLWLSYRMTEVGYRETIQMLAASRNREPNTPLGIHEQQIAVELPQLFDAFRNVFGPATSRSPHNPARVQYRGTSCIACSRVMSDPASIQIGVGPECRTRTPGACLAAGP